MVKKTTKPLDITADAEEDIKNATTDQTETETPVARTRERPADDETLADDATDTSGSETDEDQKSGETEEVEDLGVHMELAGDDADALVSSEEGTTVAQTDPLNATATDGGRNEFFDGLFEGETPEMRDERLRKAHEEEGATTGEEAAVAVSQLPSDRIARGRGHLEAIFGHFDPGKVRVILNEDTTGNDGEVFDKTTGETIFWINYGSTPKGRTTTIRDDLTGLGVDLAQIEFYGVSADYRVR